MKNNKLLLLALPLFGVPLLSGCQSEKVTTLRVLNMEDYIYLYEDDAETPEEERDHLYNLFAKEMEEKYPEMGKINVIYTTTDTNETLYNELKTGKAVYDVICPSEYMIERCIYDGLLEELPLNKDELIPNFYGEDAHVCKEIFERFTNIKATTFVTNEDSNTRVAQDTNLGNYAVGYMWGTLGLLYNPEFDKFSDEEMEAIHSAVASWDEIFNNENGLFDGTSTIKNSIRDTYAIGVIQAFKDRLSNAQKQTYPYTEEINGENITFATYSAYLEYFFNKCDKETVSLVKKALDEDKKHVYGLECDSGKQDIVNGKIGINFAWSGDAVYAMEQGDEVDTELYYAVPELGSNVWFDGWVIPKRPLNNPRTDFETTLSYEFLNYLCRDDVARMNMDYTGYTSFIAGDEVVDLLRDWYDARAEYMVAYDTVDGEEIEFDTYYLKDGEKTPIEYEDFLPTNHDSSLDSLPILYDYECLSDCDVVITEPRQLQDPFYEDHLVTYGDLTIDHLVNSTNVNICKVKEEIEYFTGELTDDEAFYSYLYLPLTDEEGNKVTYTGLDFFCQIPSSDVISRCAVMAYDPINNENMVKMWEDYKSDPLPWYCIAIFATEGVVFIGGGLIFFISKRLSLKLRKKRKQESK